jgi:hypothetical protein
MSEPSEHYESSNSGAEKNIVRNAFLLFVLVFVLANLLVFFFGTTRPSMNLLKLQENVWVQLLVQFLSFTVSLQLVRWLSPKSVIKILDSRFNIWFVYFMIFCLVAATFALLYSFAR